MVLFRIHINYDVAHIIFDYTIFLRSNFNRFFMNNYLRETSFIIVAMLAFMFSMANEGQDLFNKTCAPCHTIGKGRLVGPDLKNISEKRTQDWLIPYIQSSQTVIKSGDIDAVAIYEEFNSLLMPDQPLDAGQVVSIINYHFFCI